VLPSIDLRIQNLVKALQEVVVPAIPERERLARDQAMLVIGHLRMIAVQWKSALLFEAQSLDGLLTLADKLCAAANVGMKKEVCQRLKTEIAQSRGIDRTNGEAIQGGLVRVGSIIDEVIRGDEGQDRIPAELLTLVLEYGEYQAWRERTWFQDNMLDPGRADLPSISEMLAKSPPARSA